jgi:hypothetical protein
MPVADIIFLTAVIVAFSAFGLLLAWGVAQTKNLPKV